MSPYNHDYAAQHPHGAHTAPNMGAPSCSKTPALDERGSQSDSEDGLAYPFFPDMNVQDVDDEDPNAALTSQSLNTDGTPKRPMNAFMIFARRRRPQVSAENQAMRTGEISKLLSKEWNSMSLADKQFYLDKAKILKDNFNAKYPDYVYRRRPNNSRKKRRPAESGAHGQDRATSTDTGDDLTASAELESSESHDVLLETSADLDYPPLQEPLPGFDDSNHFGSSSPHGHPYGFPASSSAVPRRHSGIQASRASPYDRPHHGSSNSPTFPELTPPFSNYPPSLHHQPSLNSLYSSDRQSQTQGPWDSSSGADGAGGAPNWLSGSQERQLGASGLKAHPFPAPPGASPWHSGGSGNLSGSGPTSRTPNYPFPTLNSPFYPSQQQGQGNYGGTSSPTSPSGYSPTQNQLQAGMATGRPGSGFDHSGYTASPPISPLSGYPPLSRDTQAFPGHSRPPSYSSRSIPAFPNGHSSATHTPSPPGSSHQLSHAGFWSRDKPDGPQM